MKSLAAFALACAACSAGPFNHGAPDAAAADSAPGDAEGSGSGGLPAPVAAADFDHALDEAYIRAPQTWLTDDAFATKWADMITSPIELLGGANSAYHEDLGSRATALPGGEVICAGDAKFDNFGWIDAGSGVFSDIDFDDAGACPAAADILHFLLATDLQFSDPVLDDQALTAYIVTLATPSSAVAIDPTGQPVWADVLAAGIAKDTKKTKIQLGGAQQAPSQDEITAITALVAGDPRFPTTLDDIARDVQTTGGSGGLRRFWLLMEDATHPQTIIELKELVTPGTEFGPHTTTYDDASRFDVLKAYWWDQPQPDDEFGVMLLGTRFLARDRYAYLQPDATKLSSDQLANMIEAEASLMAAKHASAWVGIDPQALRPWLAASAQTLVTRWRATYTAAQ